jgi:hypothetical protein
MKTGMPNGKPGLILWLAAVLLCGCTSVSTKENARQPEKPPEPVTGRQAFQMIYPQARRWAADAQPLELRSINLSQVKSPNGKAPAWQATFVSASRAAARVYTYSAVEAEGNLHQGVFAGAEESSSGHSASSPFEISAIRIDSDEAYQTAAKKSQEYIRKNPGKPVSFLLELNKRYPDVTWRVIWGESVATSDYSVFVDATTGALVAVVH